MPILTNTDARTRDHLKSRASEYFRLAKHCFRVGRTGRDAHHSREWWRNYGLVQLAEACRYLKKLRAWEV